MAVLSRPLSLLVTAAPGTGSTSLLAWARRLPGARDVPDVDDADVDRAGVDPKHGTGAQLARHGLWDGDARILTGTRDPFDHWHAEWFRSRTRWAVDARDPGSWVNADPAIAARVARAVDQPFEPWLLAELADRAGPEHLNAGHVGEADVVVRMEHLDADLAAALPEAVAHAGPVPHRNTTDGRPDPAADHTPATIARIAEVHAPDLRRFGYAPPAVAPTGDRPA